MLNARKALLENFDVDVQERLRLRDQAAVPRWASLNAC
jgi:hypothetical protein